MLEATSIVTGLSGRYATALFELAEGQGSLSAVEQDLASLKRAIEASKDLRRLIRSPVFAREEQWKAVDAIAERMRLSPLTRRFLGVVAHNRRLFALSKILDDFFKLTARARGEIAASVTSARALDDRQLVGLKGAIKTALGRDVSLAQSLDADLLGGLIVRVGSVMVDSSLRTQLSKLQIAMREVD